MPAFAWHSPALQPALVKTGTTSLAKFIRLPAATTALGASHNSAANNTIAVKHRLVVISQSLSNLNELFNSE